MFASFEYWKILSILNKDSNELKPSLSLYNSLFGNLIFSIFTNGNSSSFKYSISSCLNICISSIILDLLYPQLSSIITIESVFETAASK